MLLRFFLFELGTTSLKFHFHRPGESKVQTLKVPWEIGHEVCTAGKISPRSIDQSVAVFRTFLDQFGKDSDPARVIVFATGVFREAENSLEFVLEVWKSTGLKVRIISSEEEAALLQSLFLATAPGPQSFAFDLGSGSLQWVYLGPEHGGERGSVPLGVIRLMRLASDSHGEFHPSRARELAAQHLACIPALWPRQVIGTGGTVRALSRIAGARTLSCEELERTQKHILEDGPPAFLKAHRLPLLLPGLILVRRLLDDLAVDELVYQDLSVGRAMLEKVLPFYSRTPVPRPTEVWRSLRLSAPLGAG